MVIPAGSGRELLGAAGSGRELLDAAGSGRELLDAAVSYALAGAAIATPAQLPRPTPCPSWDLQTLLDHLSDSIGELTVLIGSAGTAAPAVPPGPWPEGDPVARLRGQAARLRAACATSRAAARLIAIGDLEITASRVAVTGAIEITVHGWDIFSGCGTYCPVPPGLASALLSAAALLVTPRTRSGLFAAPVRLPGSACPGDQLVAFLGRQPRFPSRIAPAPAAHPSKAGHFTLSGHQMIDPAN